MDAGLPPFAAPVAPDRRPRAGELRPPPRGWHEASRAAAGTQEDLGAEDPEDKTMSGPETRAERAGITAALSRPTGAGKLCE